MKLLFCLSLLFTTTVSAQTQCPNGVCPLTVQPTVVPQRIYVPQVQYQPMQMTRMLWSQERYGLFGWRVRWTARPVYSPVQPQQSVEKQGTVWR